MTHVPLPSFAWQQAQWIKHKRQWRRPMQTSRDLSDGSVHWKRSFRPVTGGGIHYDGSVWGVC